MKLTYIRYMKCIRIIKDAIWHTLLDFTIAYIWTIEIYFKISKVWGLFHFKLYNMMKLFKS